MCSNCQKSKIITYKGFLCSLTYDHETKNFQGECRTVFPQSLLAGKSVEDLEETFKTSIDSHLSFFQEIGVDPKTFASIQTDS